MTTTIAIFVTAALAGSLGVLFGWWLRRPSEEQIRDYMSRIVNQDEFDAKQQKNMAMMHMARRKTMPRAQAYGPSRIAKVRFSRSPRPGDIRPKM